ncbi:MAG TPA: winged helix-turn-helix domain-containing protein [Solirubrobacterales bacterium]|nr:winged helix-turn-helix domain-containing protein [Solirubrobacterales bacterium]
MRIVAAALLGEITPKQIAEKEGLEVATVQYHFGKLEREKWIHVSRTEPVRGGMRKYYVGDRLNLITHREFEQMNDRNRPETSEGVLLHQLEICGEALEARTLDARGDSHLSHTPMDLDQKAWNDLRNLMDGALERILEIKVEALMRLRKSGEEPIPTVANLGAFEVPASVTAGIKAQP